MTPSLWHRRADIAQESLGYYYGVGRPQFLGNWRPSFPGSNDTFNYWWLAHVIDARLDAFARSGDNRWLQAATATRENLLARNGGSLFNDYFDDMLWFGLALERLADATRNSAFLNEAERIWAHCLEYGWNDTEGASLAWRKPQLYYKNTPANGPFAILGARLYQRGGEQRHLDYALAAWNWLTSRLVDPVTGFVEDGLNREGDGRVDTEWRFTYNQGLYVGAGVELANATGEEHFADAAERTALTALDTLTDGDVFAPEGSGGDEGLFKGIYYRYATLLARRRPLPRIEKFIEASTQRLWEVAETDGRLFPGNDWRVRPDGPVPYSTMLSAIMATEAQAALA